MQTKFNIADYPGNYVMHCKTEESAKVFCEFLQAQGLKWYDGQAYSDTTKFELNGNNTCYDFNAGQTESFLYYIHDNSTILEFTDFDW